MQPTPVICPPLIITLKLDASTFEWVNPLRQHYFPRERNFLPAHVTLFHALPGDHLLDVQTRLNQLCGQTSSFALHFPTLRFLGNGVAIAIECPELVHFRQTLATEWQTWLTSQDRQHLRPHITIQNKVPPDTARHTYETLLRQWQAADGYGEGLLLWRYQGGPWELIEEFRLQSPSEQ